MEENKFYTPSIEEFHVGFSFERTHSPSGEEYYPDTITEPWQIEEVGQYEKVRVPYLLKEDIEIEGFEFISYEFDGRIILRKNFILKNRVEEKIAELLYIPANNWCLIYIGDKEAPLGDFTTIFAGTIKNKSELRRILKMIGV